MTARADHRGASRAHRLPLIPGQRRELLALTVDLSVLSRRGPAAGLGERPKPVDLVDQFLDRLLAWRRLSRQRRRSTSRISFSCVPRSSLFWHQFVKQFCGLCATWPWILPGVRLNDAQVQVFIGAVALVVEFLQTRTPGTSPRRRVPVRVLWRAARAGRAAQSRRSRRRVAARPDD